MNAPLPAQAAPAFEPWDNPMGTDGFEFIEYAAPDPKAMGEVFFPIKKNHCFLYNIQNKKY